MSKRINKDSGRVAQKYKVASKKKKPPQSSRVSYSFSLALKNGGKHEVNDEGNPNCRM